MSDTGPNDQPPPSFTERPTAPNENGTPFQPGDHYRPPGAPSTASGTPGTTATPGTVPATADGGISVDDLLLDSQPGSPQYGHLIGIKRTIEVDPTTGKTVYGYQNIDLGDANSNLAGVAAATGIPLGALQQKIVELKANNARAQQGQNGTLIGMNPDGSFSYYDMTGTLRQTTNVAELANVGITPSKIAEATAQSGQTQRTITQMGQFTVAGMDAQGNLQVRDFNGTLSIVTAAQAAGGQIPGVSYQDFQRAQSEYASNQRTITQSGQYTLDTAQTNPFTGQTTYNVKNFNGQITPLSGADLAQRIAAGTLPGVSQSDMNQAQYKAQDLSWQLSPINTPSNAYFGNSYGSPPTGYPSTPATPAPTWTSPAPTPNPAPIGNPGPVQPGATPNPIPTSPYAGTPTAGGATPSPTPAPSPYSPAPTPGATPNPSPLSAYSAQSTTSTPAGYLAPRTDAASTPGSDALAAYGQAVNDYTKSATQNAYATGGAPTRGTMTTQTAYTGQSTNAAASPQLGAYANPASNPASMMTHQQQQQMNLAYRQNVDMTGAQNAGQSRNVSGLGFSGVQRPQLAGWG